MRINSKVFYLKLINKFNKFKKNEYIKSLYLFLMGIGDWGLGIGDWGLGPELK